MAKKSKRKSSRTWRVAPLNANTHVLPRPRIYIVQKVLPRLGEDHRRFHPQRKVRQLRTLRGKRALAAPVIRDVRKPVTFHLPPQAAVCVRRSVRKQVIFASGRAGRRGQRRPRRNLNSSVRCS